MTGPDIAAVVLRALALVAILHAAGTPLYLWFCGDHAPRTLSRVRRLGAAAAIGAIALSLAHQLLGPARMLGSFAGVLDADLHAILWSSDAGAAVTVRVLGLALVLTALVRGGRGGGALGVIGATIVACSFALLGHTATDPARWLLAPLLIVHLLFAAGWFASLPGLWLAVRYEAAVQLAAVIKAFSRAAVRSVPLIPVSGVLIAIVLLPDLAALGSEYGLWLIAKLGGFSLALGLAAVNRWRLAPAASMASPAALARLGRALFIEWWAIAAVLVATAVLTTFHSPGG
jgi:putative copper export protein